MQKKHDWSESLSYATTLNALLKE